MAISPEADAFLLRPRDRRRRRRFFGGRRMLLLSDRRTRHGSDLARQPAPALPRGRRRARRARQDRRQLPTRDDSLSFRDRPRSSRKVTTTAGGVAGVCPSACAVSSRPDVQRAGCLLRKRSMRWLKESSSRGTRSLARQGRHAMSRPRLLAAMATSSTMCALVPGTALSPSPRVLEPTVASCSGSRAHRVDVHAGLVMTNDRSGGTRSHGTSDIGVAEGSSGLASGSRARERGDYPRGPEVPSTVPLPGPCRAGPVNTRAGSDGRHRRRAARSFGSSW
jgi:hypothetical protein